MVPSYSQLYYEGEVKYINGLSHLRIIMYQFWVGIGIVSVVIIVMLKVMAMTYYHDHTMQNEGLELIQRPSCITPVVI